MKSTICLLTAAMLHVHGTGLSQTVSFSARQASLQQVFTTVKKQTGYVVFGNASLLETAHTASIDVQNMPLPDFLQLVMKDQPLNFRIADKNIIISEKTTTPSAHSVNNTEAALPPDSIRGVIFTMQGTPLPGASIRIKGTTIGTVTDTRGHFSLKQLPDNALLVISMMGYDPMEVRISKRNDGYAAAAVNDKQTGSLKVNTGQFTITVKLQEAVGQLKENVVTGYFVKSRESFTGAERTLSGQEIRQIGTGNVLQSISLLDAAVSLKESVNFGSDPNRVPEITIRGENSFDLRNSADDGKTNPNSPLFMLDGVEVNAERIYDLDMNRIENLTILKDASATALYGSRGANGVIVIRTIRPQAGEIRVTLNANYMVSAPDLRDYNLMDAREKLTYEKRAGLWTDKLKNYDTQMELDRKYNEKEKEILRGVNTYWLSKPLRTSINQRYNLYFEGGDKHFRYGITLRSENDRGVMKGSERKKTGIGITFNYDIGQTFLVRNDLFVDEVTGSNSPYGNFDIFAKENPHDRIYDENGNYILKLSSGRDNPLINATLPQKDFNRYVAIQDNFSIDWRMTPALRLQGRAGLTKQLEKTEFYRSPFSSEYATVKEPEKKGEYRTLHSESLNVDGNVTLAYNKVLGKHVLNTGVGANLLTNFKNGSGFAATGFLNDDMTFVEYAAQFKENSKPTGIFDKSRMIGFFANLNYGYDNRYFIDASYRTDGSSKFGRDARFAPFWAVGFAWNVNREAFWGASSSLLKIRGSAGSTGTINFSSNQALTAYRYSQSSEYNGNLGARLMGFGNSSLRWQNTLSYNIGADLTLFKNFLQVNVDGYIKLTDNLLLPIDVAPSTGFTSYVENMGQMKNSGIDARIRMNLIRDRKHNLNWSVTLAALSNQNKIQKLSNALEVMNTEANKAENVKGPQPLRTYEVGRSQSALMVVRSAGIDPATGNEIYIKRNGEYTFDYDYRDKVVVGDTRATVEGNFSSNLNWNGLNLLAVFSYRVGGKIFNSTLKTSVEGANPLFNADRRVLYDRWQEPGSTAKFKRIDDTSESYQTDRYVQDNNQLSLSSLSLTYDLPRGTAKKMRAERVRLQLSSTELIRFSTVKAERGTLYPYAQTFNGGFNVTF
ncbi:SusC/RagA family TonB-linked outer membrane protein [Chitinophaga nivalis]|uniref:SusC/RagA family TonB-linked outer membrane protein n=1 Tax=Chitinophaga nivalis TaxID=2991709 RepID=A0ABT3IJN2_9BACT|nr:SusC/RagA family TonB-linked outer membrane protein [Chitinophaga nivalis]MCW3466137.1 SusC/RagA family TonB-linked outer membrane protein [Chitinophaga nivalis]MCW3484172.1 SusC/RagA family TonB-linked outer membrane protein [Chitinophaga nivalis]